MTKILSNGNKWIGDKPGSIEDLFDVLAREPLDPTFAPFGRNNGNGVVLFFGNCHALSWPFAIETDDPDLCARLTAAIQANEATDGYAEAMRVCEDYARQRQLNSMRQRLADTAGRVRRARAAR